MNSAYKTLFKSHLEDLIRIPELNQFQKSSKFYFQGIF